MARRFARMGGITGEDKFAQGEWGPDARGVPLLTDAVLGFSCNVTHVTVAGSHCIFIGQILDIVQQDGGALIYEQSGFHRLERI